MRPSACLLAAAWAVSQAGAQEPDFKFQGEFAASGAGAQVIARGGGQFTAVFFEGGLPGAGGIAQSRFEVSGSLQGDHVAFQGADWSAVISANGDTLKTQSGENAATVLLKTLREGPTLGAPAPAGGIVLFDGSGVSAWTDAELTADKLLRPQGASATQGAVTKQKFQSFTLHLEFREPFKPTATGLQRGNSGVYLQGRQELQILDSFGAKLDNGADTMAAKRVCGAFWEMHAPAVNASLPPRSWQTYDVDFTAAKYDGSGKTLLEPAYATVKLNGMVVHQGRALRSHTLAGDLMGPTPGPLRFQAYGDSVLYRNIWLVENDGAAIRRGTLRAPVTGASRGSLASLNGRSAPQTLPAAGFYIMRTPQPRLLRYLSP